ncbi:hypothetical protein GWN75_21855 [candidate division KSB1 bacterium]|nr:hypothetical protein [candidate division KSB1 bacterium]NIS26424.1 hypothetical protein [candidate division KSB1 bacterium]NIU27110.1 hypothetical protein [candidate division KSB1 bacterium]NIU93047.1 hypothetical protein [candidate division KSB1 bacterium]NIW20988.1 hypothetical protein [candidate division KSB1 bacterium]
MLLDSLNRERAGSPGWTERKEIAAWAALVFYLAGLWSLFSVTVNYEITFSFWVFPGFILLLVLLLVFILIFIHAQYVSIYFNSSYSKAVRRACFELIDAIEKKKWDEAVKKFSLDFDKQSDSYPKFIENRLIEIRQKEVQPYSGKKHVCRILCELWRYICIRLSGKEDNTKDQELSPTSRQEAVLYYLAIVPTVGLIIYLACRW